LRGKKAASTRGSYSISSTREGEEEEEEEEDEYKRVLNFPVSFLISRAIQLVGFEAQPCTPYFDSYPQGHLPSVSPSPDLSNVVTCRSSSSSSSPNFEFSENFTGFGKELSFLPPPGQEEKEPSTHSNNNDNNDNASKERITISAATHCLLFFDVANLLNQPLEVFACGERGLAVRYWLKKGGKVRLVVPMERIDMGKEEMEELLGPNTKQFIKSKLTSEEEENKKRQKCHKILILRKVRMGWRDCASSSSSPASSPSSSRSGRVFFDNFSVSNATLKQISRPSLSFSYSIAPATPPSSSPSPPSPSLLPPTLRASSQIGYLSLLSPASLSTLYTISFTIKNQGKRPLNLGLCVTPAIDERTLLTGGASQADLAHRMSYIGALNCDLPTILEVGEEFTHSVFVNFLFPGVFYFSFFCTEVESGEVSRSPSILAVVVKEDE